MLSEWIIISFCAITILIIYKLIKWVVSPFVIVKDISDIGYNHINEKYLKNKNAGALAINRFKRIRKSGAKIPPPYPNGWFAVAESADVKTGNAISVDILGENLVVFRSENGHASVLNAYCSHLGANLGVGGIVKGDCIECPFHQWKFDGNNGECVNVPYSLSIPVVKLSKLKKWTSCEINGSIFIWYHVDDSVEPWKMPSVKEIEIGEWLYYGKNEYLVNCHIQEIPENGADVAHLNSVHAPNLISGSDLRYSRNWWTSFGLHAWNAQWRASENLNETHMATVELTHCMKLFNHFQISTMNVHVVQIGPGYVQLFLDSSFGKFVILQTVVPVEPLVQRVIHRFYMPKNLSLFSKFVIWGETIMFERDMMIWNNKCYIDNPCLMKEDRLIKSFRNWFAQFYTENSKTYAEAYQSLQW